MKRKSSLLFVFIIFIGLYVFFPQQVVWGGNSGQTVPTIGPRPTASETSTFTPTNSTNTTSTATVPVTQKLTIAITLITPVVNDSTGTVVSDNPDAEINPKTQAISSPVANETSESSSGDDLNQSINDGNRTGQVQSNQDLSPVYLPPQWLFPLIVVFFLVLIFLIIKRLIRDHNKKNLEK